MPSRTKKSRRAAAAVATATAGFLIASAVAPASAAVDEFGPLSTLESVAQANPVAVAQAVTGGTATATAAVDASTGRVDIALPETAADGIVLEKNDGSSLTLGLPFAGDADSAELLDAGVVGYDNNNDSTTVPVAVDDGTLAVHTVIDSAAAPTEYAYDLGIDAGSQIEVYETGEVVVLDADGGFQFAVAAPWARDANGADVPTHYTLNGTTLTQIVEHGVGDTYPVVADPTIGGFYMDRYQWNAAGDRITIWPTVAGYTFQPALVAQFGWPELVQKTSKVNKATYHQQFICHAAGNLLTSFQTWDLEGWRGTQSNPAVWVGELCNW